MRTDLLALSALLSWLVAAPATTDPPAPLTVTARPAPEQGALACKGASLTAQLLSDHGAPKGTPLVSPLALNIAVPLRLSPGPWQLSLASTDCWGPTRKVLLGGSRSQVLEIPVFRQTRAEGLLQPPRGSSLPEKLRLKFSSSFANPQAAEPNADVFCDISAEGGFSCPIPVASVDLRLSVEGFAPVYRWGVAVPPNSPMKLGNVPLVQGAALAGWLLTQEGGPPEIEDVALRLVPLGLADTKSVGEERQQRLSTVEVKPLASGFFQFRSLNAGSYMLFVGGRGYAEDRLPVDVVAGRESVMQDPVLMQPPMVATFSVTPPSDVEGGNWRIVLKRLHEAETYADDVVNQEVPLDGWYEAKGLNPGTYLVQILDPKGDGVAARQVILGEEPMPIQIEVGSVRVFGRMTLGKKPLAGTIWFGGQAGAEKVTAESDGEGRFVSSLPRAGEWYVEVAAEKPRVMVRFRKLEVPESKDGRPVEVNFALANTRLRGLVREQDGGPPQGATRVYAISGRPGRHPSQAVGMDGRFEFQGLEEGVFQIQAVRLGARSETRPVKLAKDLEQEVALTLDPVQNIRGIVTGPHGGIPGAYVQLLPADNPWAILLPAPCDGAGRFTAELPRGTQEVFATVSAPGGTMGAFKTWVREGEELIFRLPMDGGSLLIELPKEGIEWDGDTTPIFFRDGIPFAARDIEMWAQNHRRKAGRAGFLVAPNLVAGHYEACHVAIADYGATLLGQLARRNCVAGNLSPLGELTLKLPSVKSK